MGNGGNYIGTESVVDGKNGFLFGFFDSQTFLVNIERQLFDLEGIGLEKGPREVCEGVRQLLPHKISI